MGYPYPSLGARFVKEDGTVVNIAENIDGFNNVIKIGSLQKRWRDNFGDSAIDGSKWNLLQQGAGQTLTVASNRLTISAGVTANSETILESVDYFTLPLKVFFGATISQKIANQEIYFELVSIDSTTKITDGKHCAAWKVAYADNATATYGNYQVQTNSATRLDGIVSIVNNVTSANVYEIEASTDDCWFHVKTMDSTMGRAFSVKRDKQIPDPNCYYKLRIRIKNLATAPATSTNVILDFVCVSDYSEVMAEITSGNGGTAQGQAMPVTLANTSVNVSSIGGTAPQTSGLAGVQQVSIGSGAGTNNLTNYKYITAATTNPVSLKSSPGRIATINVINTTASFKYFKLYNKASAPTVGTDVPMSVVGIPPNTCVPFNIPCGIYLSTGIGFAVTGASADNDTTAVAVGDVIINLQYA